MVEASLDPVLEELAGCWTKRVSEWEVEGMVKHWESVATLPQLMAAMVLAGCAFAATDLESLSTPFHGLLPPSHFL